MARTKIVVIAAALGHRKKPFHVNVAGRTTSREVVDKVLEKLQCGDPPLRYQLWAVTEEREQSLRDEELPAAVKEQWAEQGVEPQFQLRLRASGIIRIQHRLNGDQETFRSLIVTPHMTSCDVLQVALPQIAPEEKYTDYHLIQKTPQGERVIGNDEYPLLLLTGATQLVLRNKHQPLSLPLTLTPPPECSPTGSDHHSPLSPSSPDRTSSLDHTPSALSVQRSWLSMHHDLITALSEFTTALSQRRGDDDRVAGGTREGVLEQSLVQQNQIVEMLQNMVGSLESENESVRKKVSNLEQKLHKLSMWKSRARQAEEKLSRMMESSGAVTLSGGGAVSFSTLAGYEKMLSEKDKVIASLRARVSGEGSTDQQSSSLSTEAKLAAERVRAMELEEELLTCRAESRKTHGVLSEYQSDVTRRESEVQYLRHEVETVKKVGQQQQELVMGLRTALLDRDAQISSLTRALARKSEESKRRPSVTHKSSSQSIFDLLLGREVFTIEARRESEEGEIGFSVSQFEMPISSRMSMLIVKAVKEGSSVHGLLQPGDEILEVNGFKCRSAASQRKAVEALERGKMRLKIVAARERGPVEFVACLRGTSVASETSQSTLWVTADDSSFAPLSLSHNPPSLPTSPPPSLPTSPPHYHLTLPTSPDSASTTGNIPLASHTRPQPIGQVKVIESTPTEEPSTTRPSRSGVSEHFPELQSEVQRLREETGQWQEVQSEMEEELNTTHTELETIKSEYQHTLATNSDLQQQVKLGKRELSKSQRQVEELQQLLVGVRDKVEREGERVRALEEQNNTLQRTITEISTVQAQERQRASESEEELMQLKVEFEKEKSEVSRKMATLQSHNEQLEAEVKLREAQREAALTLVRECESRQEREKREGEEKTERLTTELQSLREQLAREMSSSQSEVQGLQKQLATMKTLLVDAEKKEVEMKMENRHLRQAADESNKQLSELHVTHRSLEEKLAVIREQAESKTLECESLTLGLKKTEAKLKANEEMSSRLQQENDNLRRSNKQLFVEKVKAVEECNKAEKERSKVEVQLRICQSEQAQEREKFESQTGEGDELFSQLESVVAENTAMQQQLNTTQEKLRSVENESEQLKRQLEETSNSLEVAGGDKQSLQSELSIEQTKTESLKESLAAAEAAVEGVEAGKKKSGDLVASMMFVHEQDQARIRELEEMLAAAQTGLEEIRDEMNIVQTELKTESQELETECAGLRERVRGLTEQLDTERASQASELAVLRESLSSSEQTVSKLQVELEALESANSINKATITQLQTGSEQGEEERERMEARLEEVVGRAHQVQSELDKLQSHSQSLEAKNIQLSNERDNLIGSSADVASSLRQTQAQVDTLSARLEAAQQNQTVTEQRLEQALTGEQDMRNKFTELEKKFNENEKKLEKEETRSHEVTLSLHRREEELSQLTAQLELGHRGQQQLQNSLVSLQKATKSWEEKIVCLEAEKEKLRAAVERLKTERENLKKVVTSLKNEKTEMGKQQLVEVEGLRQQLAEKTTAENDHLTTIQRLGRSYNEEKSMVEQLLAAQEALKSSLTSLGDKREGELVRLREQIVSLERSLVETQQLASQSKSREDALQTQLSAATSAAETASERCAELEDESERLREEAERHKDIETQVTELLHKIEVLEERQRERNGKLVSAESELDQTSRELESARSENAALLERVGEVAAVSVSLAEKTAELERLRGELAAEVKVRQEVLNEKEQLLGVLRRLEVEKHTSTPPQEPASVSLEADHDKLMDTVREREEEAVRLRDYVHKLLSAVVEKAPFVLERLE